MSQKEPLMANDALDHPQMYGSHHHPSQHRLEDSLADSELSSELISEPPVPIPPDNIAHGTINTANIHRHSFSGNNNNQSNPISQSQSNNPNFHNQYNSNTNTTNTQASIAMPGTAHILGSGSGVSRIPPGSSHIFGSGQTQGSLREPSYHNRQPGASTPQYNGNGDGGLYGGDDNTIPLVKKSTLILILFGILCSIVAVIAVLLLTFQEEHSGKDNGNDVDSLKTITLLRNIRCVLIPLGIYIINIIVCATFYTESKRLQLHGYSNFFSRTSFIVKTNFRASSAYFTVAFAAYGFLSNDHNKLGIKVGALSWIFLGVWIFIFFAVIYFLYQFFYEFYGHNKLKPPPNLFQPQTMESTQIAQSPNSGARHPTNDPKSVIRQLFNDKKTLQRQLKNVSAQLTQTQKKLKAIGNRSGGINIGGSPRPSFDGNLASEDDGFVRKPSNTTILALEDELRKLNSNIRTSKGTIKTMRTEIQTQQTVLDSKKNECDQQKGLIANYEQRIANLSNEKEQLERALNQAYDQKDDGKILLQVKEEEITIAKGENKRLRTQMMQMQQQLNSYQNIHHQPQSQHDMQQHNNQYR